MLFGTFSGSIALLLTALVMMRFIPNGISSLLRRPSRASR
jgi:hypothetical protein